MSPDSSNKGGNSSSHSNSKNGRNGGVAKDSDETRGQHKRRRRNGSLRGQSCKLQALAKLLVGTQSNDSHSHSTIHNNATDAPTTISTNNVVFITGAGLSVASGVRPFRGPSGLWSEVIWRQGTREQFRKDPLEWYNTFWLPHFHSKAVQRAQPNKGHTALQQLQQLLPASVTIITQNIDNLQQAGVESATTSGAGSHHYHSTVIEAHGRIGLYKCIPESDSDTDSDSDDEDDRLVHLGHRRKNRILREQLATTEAAKSTVPQYQGGDALGRAQQSASIFTTMSGYCGHGGGRASKRATMLGGSARMTTTNAPASATSIRKSTRHADNSSSKKKKKKKQPCKYQLTDSLYVSQLRPVSVAQQLMSMTAALLDRDDDDDNDDENVHKSDTTTTTTSTGSNNGNTVSSPHLPEKYRLSQPPCCPECGRPCPPQALLFDEGYHSHDFYQFRRMETALEGARALVFVGTSFAVTLTQVALQHAKDHGLAVYNFNTNDLLEPSPRLNAENIVGRADETLPQLVEWVRREQEEQTGRMVAVQRRQQQEG